MELKPGLSALVTGGASGIGKIITITFLSTIICENFEFRFQLTSQIIRIQYLLGFISLTDWKLISRFFFYFFYFFCVQFFFCLTRMLLVDVATEIWSNYPKKKKKKITPRKCYFSVYEIFWMQTEQWSSQLVHKFKMIGIRLFVFCENWYIDWHLKQAVWLW